MPDCFVQAMAFDRLYPEMDLKVGLFQPEGDYIGITPVMGIRPIAKSIILLGIYLERFFLI